MLSLATKFIIAFAVGFAVCTVLTALVRMLAVRMHILDKPDIERKIHGTAMPLWGGLAVYLSLVVTVIVLYTLGWLVDDRVPLSLLVGLGVAGGLLVGGGMLDDRFHLSWCKQVFFPVMAALAILLFGLEISYVSNPFGGGLLQLNEWRTSMTFAGVSFVFSPLADALLFVWILGMVYTTKLLDGVDGLTTSISSIAALVIFVVSLAWDRTGSTTSFLALALAGAGAGFLVWNWHPAKIFLGESGSTYFGFMLAVLAVISGGKIATALLVMGIPILDVVRIIFRRLRSGSKIYSGDDQHLHFRLLKAGLSQRQVVVVLSGFSLMFGSVAFFFTTRGKLIALAALLLSMVLLARISTTRSTASRNR